MGHSVGEYVAACLAGVFSLEDGLRLIAERGRLMSCAAARRQHGSGLRRRSAGARGAGAGMKRCCPIAAVNGPENTVISGRHRRTVEARACSSSRPQGVDVQRLNVSHAFHSPLMEPMLDRLRGVWRRPCDVLAATHGSWSPTSAAGWPACELCSAGILARHLREAVRFADSIATLQPATATGCLRRGRAAPDAARHGAALPGGRRLLVGRLAAQRPRRRRRRCSKASASCTCCGLADSLGRPCSARTARRRRATLPSYPFQRERIGSARARAKAAGRARPPHSAGIRCSAASLPSPLHIFQSELGVERPALAGDHRIFDFTLFPGDRLSRAGARPQPAKCSAPTR